MAKSDIKSTNPKRTLGFGLLKASVMEAEQLPLPKATAPPSRSLCSGDWVWGIETDLEM